MKKSNILITAALSSVIIMASTSVYSAKPGFEKCAGIVKVGKNDCGNSSHKCAGMAGKDGAANEWIYVPEGTCEKIVGGTLFKKKK